MERGMSEPAARILLRSPKAPFEVTPLRAILARDILANNTGNLVFLHAAYRLLATPEARIASDGMRIRPADADRINAEHDIYVLPFANAFRPQFANRLQRWTRLIRRLRIPVVVLGIGAQSSLDYDLAPLARIDPIVREFVAAVLDRGPSIGVRGEFTERYLRHLGFRDVEVIGCPSVFMDGPTLRVEKRVARLDTDAPMAFNTAPSQASLGPLLRDLARRHPGLTYVAQDRAALEVLALGAVQRGAPPPPGFPSSRGDPLVRERRVRVFPDPWPWIDFLRTVDFAFGSRAHGNLVSLVAGTPAYILAHDSRTLELARYHEVPHRPVPANPLEVDPLALYESADYGPLNRGHAARWATFEGYLRRHGLASVFDAGGSEAFDARIARLRFPVPGDPASPGGTLGLGYRLRGRLRRVVRRLCGRRTGKRSRAGGGARTGGHGGGSR
jgi:Polysaccharide pyruvyl transferase